MCVCVCIQKKKFYIFFFLVREKKIEHVAIRQKKTNKHRINELERQQDQKKKKKNHHIHCWLAGSIQSINSVLYFRCRMITNYREKEREKKTITRNELYMDKQTLQKTNTHITQRHRKRDCKVSLYLHIYYIQSQ